MDGHFDFFNTKSYWRRDNIHDHGPRDALLRSRHDAMCGALLPYQKLGVNRSIALRNTYCFVFGLVQHMKWISGLVRLSQR